MKATYLSRRYLTKERLASFWHQVDDTLDLQAADVLEVGPGPGLVTGWLRQAGVAVTTVDVDPELEPDIQASVVDLPLEARSVDVVLCSQVLEHIPFDQACLGLAEMSRVARKGVVVSLPDARPWLGLRYPLYFGIYVEELRRQIPATRAGLLRALLTRRLRLRDALFTRVVPARWGLGGGAAEWRRAPIPHGAWQLPPGDDHFWEIGMTGYPLGRILRAFDEAGLTLLRDYRVPENPWHHFFVARPR